MGPVMTDETVGGDRFSLASRGEKAELEEIRKERVDN